MACRFFSMNNTYLFFGDHKYWPMTDWEDLEPGVTSSSIAPASTGTAGISSFNLGTRGSPRIIRLTPPIKVQLNWKGYR